MKSTHRGHTIEVRREECLGGWPLLYFTIIRDSDGYFCEDSFEDSEETVRDKIKQLKARIDAELEECDPWEEEGLMSQQLSDATYDTLVRNHVSNISRAFGDGYKDKNWLGLIIEGHNEGDCPTCDAYRQMQREEEADE